MSNQISAPNRPTATVIEDTDFFVLDRGENGVTYRVPGSLINAPFRVWEGLVTQVGTDDPTAVVLENNLLGAITFNYISPGVFGVESVGLFLANKTVPIFVAGEAIRMSSDLIEVSSAQSFTNRYLEIRIYK